MASSVVENMDLEVYSVKWDFLAPCRVEMRDDTGDWWGVGAGWGDILNLSM